MNPMNLGLAYLSRRRFIGCLASASLASHSLLAADDKADDLQDLLRTIIKDSQVPAMAGGAMRGGKLVALAVSGVRRLGHPETVTTDDKFHIGSCTKAMTASLAAMLVESKKLGWDSKLTEVFPERREKFHSEFRDTTLEILLTHRSGLAHDGSFQGIPKKPVTEQRLAYMDAILSKPPAHEVGAFNYSNAGYIIVGAMLERLTGKSWEDLIQEKLFTPLSMTSAGFGPCSKPNQTDQPWGHVFVADTFVPRYGDNHPGLGPAGTVHCSVADYLKFASWHASMGTRHPELLTRPSFEKLHEPAKSSYAKGWVVAKRPWAKGTALTHTGSNTMNFLVVWVAPEIDLALAVACNAASDKVPRAMDRLAAEFVKRFAA
jgi:CubicO group peptidase (beta-lactamase class C family)